MKCSTALVPHRLRTLIKRQFIQNEFTAKFNLMKGIKNEATRSVTDLFHLLPYHWCTTGAKMVVPVGACIRTSLTVCHSNHRLGLSRCVTHCPGYRQRESILLITQPGSNTLLHVYQEYKAEEGGLSRQSPATVRYLVLQNTPSHVHLLHSP